jgi:outer membrane receptor for ferrienterochelin and colicin
VKYFFRGLSVLLLVACAIPMLAQGVTGSLTGTVTTGGSPLPGVTVTLTSPALQGTRTTATESTGAYHFPALPPGRYTVSFELAGMQQVNKTVQVNLAQTSRADAELAVASVSEAMTVTATAPPVLETSEVATNFQGQQIEELPLDRTIRDTVLIAPGVNDAGPNDQISISGAQSFDNLFLVNGVVVNENLRGQPHNLFIEDAVQETTVLSGGVSAEYGRFTGGVVSTLTKSGGNKFSGSIRDNISNDDWQDKTPFPNQADKLDEQNDTFEATLGGRIIRDRLWFFAAGRQEERETSAQTFNTVIPFAQTRKDDRWEAKLTGQITQNHSAVVSYLDSQLDRTGVTSGNIVDLRSLATRSEPNTLLSAHYNGILSNSFLIEGQYSKMDFSFYQGAETRDLVEGTILLNATGSARRGWSPTFCGKICGEKERDNESWLAKGTYFLATPSLGNHNIASGYEEFHQLRRENNFQSGSDFRIHGHFFFSGQNIGFGVDPSNAEIEYDPVPALSETSDFAVRSVFVNDKWDLNNRWGFNVGLRYDQAFGKDQAGNKTVDDTQFSPRLAATFDPAGNGRHRFSASYGRYVSKVDQGPADNTATAGRYASYYYDYEGPAINPVGTPFNQLVPIPQVISQVFAWFNANGGTSSGEYLLSAFIPGVTTQFREKLEAPYMDEYIVGYGTAFTNGYAKIDFVNREWDKFYTVFRTRETGTVVDPNGRTQDVGFIQNSTGQLERDYRGVQVQGSYRIFSNLNLGGNYTWSKLRGNVEGEAASFATTFTDEFNYPEYTNFEQNRPVGFLDADIRHRANVWLQYDLDTPIGEFNLSLLERYHSGLPYSGTALIATTPITNPGYSRPPTTANYFFTDRGELRLDDITSTDLGVNYALPIMGVRLFAQVDILNFFNEHGVEDPTFVNQTALTSRSATCTQLSNGPTPGARCLAFNPFTTAAVEGIHYRLPADFGQPTSPDAYQTPRTYRFSVGLRF